MPAKRLHLPRQALSCTGRRHVTSLGVVKGYQPMDSFGTEAAEGRIDQALLQPAGLAGSRRVAILVRLSPGNQCPARTPSLKPARGAR